MSDAAEPDNLFEGANAPEEQAGEQQPESQTPPEGEQVSGGEGSAPEAKPGEEARPEQPIVSEEGEEGEGGDTPKERPEHIPEKFWDAEKGEPRLEEMAKSYQELERRLHEKGQESVPEKYEVKLPEELTEAGVEGLSEEDEKLFKDAGLTNEQAQKLTEHFYSSVVPELQKALVSAEAGELERDWGMKRDSDAFKARMAKVKEYAEQNFPKGVVQELARSASGVQQLWKAMEQGSTASVTAPSAAPAVKSKAEIEQMMQDPRYWEDPAYQKQVEAEADRAFGRG